jgi:hypothetical protein
MCDFLSTLILLRIKATPGLEYIIQQAEIPNENKKKAPSAKQLREHMTKLEYCPKKLLQIQNLPRNRFI